MPTEPVLAAILTSGDGALVRQLLRNPGPEADVAVVIRDRPSAIDDGGVPSGLRRGATLGLLAELGVDLVDCYVPKRGGTREDRMLKQEANVLYTCGDHGVQLLVLINYDRDLIKDGPLLSRYGGRMLHISEGVLSIIKADGITKPHATLGPDDTLETILLSFAAEPVRVPSKERWLATAERLGYASEQEMWVELYVRAGMSMIEVAEKVDAAPETIRTRLLLSGVPPRARGGAHAVLLKDAMTDDQLEEILTEGIAPAAKRLGLNYFTLYTRVKRALNRRRQAKVAERERH